MINKSKIDLNCFKKLFVLLMFVVSFIYFGVFRYLIIPSGDDYFWGGKQGNYLIHHMFYGLQAIYGGSSNGRYLGNTLEILTMHHLWFAMLMYGILWTLLIWVMWRLTGKSISSLVISCLFVFTLQDGFINNILAWNAGFINYVPPIAMILVYILITDRGRYKNFSPYIALLTLILAYASGLFVEALTITQIVLGIFVILYFRKKVKLYHLTYLIGAIISAITMFSQPGYRETSSYRGTTFDPLKIWDIYAKITHFWLITFNVALIIGLLLAIIILLVKSDFSWIKKTSLTLISVLFMAYYAGINYYLQRIPLNYMYGYNVINTRLAYIDGAISLAFVIFIGYCIFLFFKNDVKMWLYYLLTGVLMGQLLFVSAPINCRGNFLTYVFMYLIAMKFVVMAIAQSNLKNLLTGLLLLGLLSMGAWYQYMIYANSQANLRRVNNISFYTGEKELDKHVPYRKFVWSNDLMNQQNPTYWKEYLKK
ncbi:hypothetical protein [Companilactobacillus crustorum]|uniref:hypothetical protein n=1 Tax=Companilactobacillus crustorum TaxID=392416 RepID=UPI0012EC843B|nr:hypothetical protein [Companilactobacillus crustorum]